jgi:hypothetical protein
MRADRRGFVVDFTVPMDAAKMARAENYELASYRRQSTPAYGGPDEDRRTETIRAVEPSADARSATLVLDRLRAGFVYELRVKDIAPAAAALHPAEAYFTLRRIPE